MLNTKHLLILGCVKTKRELAPGHTVPACELYWSPLWAKRENYALAQKWMWVILSAEHGLIMPMTEIKSYDTSISSVPRGESPWHNQVTAALNKLAHEGIIHVEIHAGAPYVERFREAAARAKAIIVTSTPLKGLQIGEQLRWYKQQGGV